MYITMFGDLAAVVGNGGRGSPPAASAGVSTAMMPPSSPAVSTMPSLAMFGGPGPAGFTLWKMRVPMSAAMATTATMMPPWMRIRLRRSRFFCSSRRSRAFSRAASLRSLRDGRG